MTTSWYNATTSVKTCIRQTPVPGNPPSPLHLSMTFRHVSRLKATAKITCSQCGVTQADPTVLHRHVCVESRKWDRRFKYSFYFAQCLLIIQTYTVVMYKIWLLIDRFSMTAAALYVAYFGTDISTQQYVAVHPMWGFGEHAVVV